MSSSEKADKDQSYSGFSLLTMPYPGALLGYTLITRFLEGLIFEGCELFVEYESQSRDDIRGKVKFDWTQVTKHINKEKKRDFRLSFVGLY